jgi:TetR/AcrR family transcriptional repressor of nem operon
MKFGTRDAGTKSAQIFPSTIAILTCILVGMLTDRRRRSAVVHRDPERTRKRLLQAAFQEVHRAGFRSADMDAILAAAGVTKGALYHHFGSKEALGYAIVDEVIASITHDKWLHPLQNSKNPIDTLVAIVQSTSVRPEDVERGCPLNNLAQEMSPIDEGFRKRTARVFKSWHDAIAVALREAQKRGFVRNGVNPHEAATFLIAMYEGYLSLAKNSQDPRILRSGQRNLTGHLESLRTLRRRPAVGGQG